SKMEVRLCPACGNKFGVFPELAGKLVACPKCKASIRAAAATATAERVVPSKRVVPLGDDEPDVVAVEIPDEPADRAPVRPAKMPAVPEVPKPRRPKLLRKRSPEAAKRGSRALLLIGSGIAAVLLLAVFILWQIFRPLPDFSTPGEVG